jgi:hypothetical protein
MGHVEMIAKSLNVALPQMGHFEMMAKSLNVAPPQVGHFEMIARSLNVCIIIIIIFFFFFFFFFFLSLERLQGCFSGCCFILSDLCGHMMLMMMMMYVCLFLPILKALYFRPDPNAV